MVEVDVPEVDVGGVGEIEGGNDLVGRVRRFGVYMAH